MGIFSLFFQLRQGQKCKMVLSVDAVTSTTKLDEQQQTVSTFGFGDDAVSCKHA